jgi:hypothetical protein
MAMTRRDFLAGSGAAVMTASLRAQARPYTLETIAAGKTLRDPRGNVVLSYLTSKPEGVPLAGNSVCCIHPFNTPGGERATDIAPVDHRDHRGIFFAWHDMSFRRRNAAGAQGDDLKADFWGWGAHAPVEGRVIKNRDVRLVRADENTADIEVVNDWMIGADRMMQATETIHAGQLQDRGRTLDLRYVFTSDYDVTLNPMAFTGFCFRCRKEGPYTFFNPDGEVTLEKFPNSNANRPETDWPAKPWYRHQVTLQNGKVVSSVVVDHPSNPPSLWHGARSVSFLNPCISASGPVEIPAGKALTLRYLAIASDGEMSPGWLNGVADEWRGKR